MYRSRSEPQIFATQKNIIGDHIANAVPGYMGFCPARRLEGSTMGAGHSRSLELSQTARSRKTYDQQAHRLSREATVRTLRSTVPAAMAPTYDSRGICYPPAGDTHHSRVPVAGEDKSHHHLHSTMGLTSATHEKLGGGTQLKGYGKSMIGIPGYTGFVPGKAAENIVADTWSKTVERSVHTHFDARRRAPKQWGLLTKEGTAIAHVTADSLAEVPIKNPSYQCLSKGWSDCRLTGKHVDPAGRLAPHGRQEDYGCEMPPVNKVGYRPVEPIHRYTGFVPGRVSENVVGERQSVSNAISDQLHKKFRMRITQR
ncbi:unnamed protein product [Polarella glacialis]|uniref:Uncharacterized protein n=1 Tax=Polarella glacialis TaxID=89957 RepID=A0A813HDP6_POLGL|nr:unnamed protein product [Polarella glacialis]